MAVLLCLYSRQQSDGRTQHQMQHRAEHHSLHLLLHFYGVHGPTRLTCATSSCLLSALTFNSSARAPLSACSTRRLTRGQRRRKGTRTPTTAARRTMRAGMHARARGTQPRSLPSPQPPQPVEPARLTLCGCVIVTNFRNVSLESQSQSSQSQRCGMRVYQKIRMLTAQDVFRC